MAIDLFPQQAEKNNTIDLLNTRPQISDQDAEVRSERYHYATQNLLRIDEIRAGVMLGYEDRIREQVYLDEQVKESTRRSNMIKSISDVAAMDGRGLSEDEKNQILEISSQESTVDPNTILERLYAKRFTEEFTQSAPETQELPAEVTKTIQDHTEDMLTKQQIALRIAEEQSSRFDRAGFGIQALDFVEGLVPGLTWARLQNRVKDTGSEGEFLPGSNLAAQIRGLYMMSPEDFEKNLRAAVEALSNESIWDAAQLAQAAVEYSNSDEGWDNVFGALDAVDIATIGGGIALKLARRSRSALKATQAGTSINRKVALGDIEGAADEAVLGRVNLQNGVYSPHTKIDTSRPQQQIDALVDAYPDMFNPNRRFNNPGSLTSTRQQRLMTEMSNSQNLLLSTFDLPFVERVTDEAATKEILDAAKKRFTVTNHRLDQAIITSRPVLESRETFGGVDYVEFLIGHKDGVGFVSEAAAKNFADRIYRLTPNSYDIMEESGNWFIRMTQNVDETDINAAFKRIQTENKAPETFLNQWIWGLRSADYLVSTEHTKWRKLLTYGGNAVMDKIQKSISNLTSLGKNEASRLRDVMEEAQYMTRVITQPDGTKKSVSGHFYDTIGEFEQAYLNKHQMMPSDKEIAAYFEFRDIMDWDLLMRNVSSLRDKSRLGMEQYSFDFQVPIEGSKKTQKKNMPFFEGRVVESLPDMGAGTVRIGWINDKGKARFGKYDRLFQKERDELRSLIDSGDYRIIQLADPRSSGMRDVFKTYGEPVQYVVVKNPKQAPLNFLQVPRNEGGHWMYPQHGNYIKQANVHQGMGEYIYDGDITLYHAPVRSVAESLAKDMETARLMRNNKDPRLAQFVTSKLPFKSMKDFESRWFDAKLNPDGAFNPNAPFVVTEHGQSARDVVKLEDYLGQPVFDSAGDANSLSSKIFSQYTQERSDRLLSVDTVGTQTNPIYKLSPAPTLDPFKSLSISAASLVRSRFLDDYKHRAVEDWIAQFSDVLDAPLAELRANPLKALKEGNWRKKADNNKLAAAKANRMAVLSLLGQETYFHRAWKYTRQKMVDLVYQRMGKKPAAILDNIFWDSKTDPAVVMRSIVFHAKLGLFNPAQLALQASTAAMAMAIDGNPQRVGRALPLFTGLRAAQAAAINPGAQKKIFEATAKAVGMKADEVSEMYRVWQKSGANIIEGEYGPLDDAINPKQFLSKSTGGQALDAGLFFFREGNQIHRGSAFTLSYLKWLDENPGKVMKNRDVAAVINRMDNLYLNMSRASNAAWQTNPEAWYQPLTSTIGQFAGFPARLAEEFLAGAFGGRANLTGMEKARLMITNSLIWGIPFGAGSLVAGAVWPVGESVKEYIVGNNLPYDDNLVTRVLVDGVADVIAEQLIGTDVNVTERFGPGGVSLFKDIFTGDWEDSLGASPSFLNQLLMSTEPFRMVTFNLFNDGPRPQLVWQDFASALQEVSSAYQGLRAYMVYNAGEWINKSGQTVANVPKGDAALAIAVAIGLTPQEVTDMYARYQNTAALEEDKRRIGDMALIEFQRYVKAAAEGDMEQAMVFYKRADAFLSAGGFTVLEKANLRQRALSENRTMMDRVDKDFWLAKPEERTKWFIDREERRIRMGY